MYPFICKRIYLLWRDAVELRQQSYAIFLLDHDGLQSLLILLHLIISNM